jgi:hypothetical protein
MACLKMLSVISWLKSTFINFEKIIRVDRLAIYYILPMKKTLCLPLNYLSGEYVGFLLARLPIKNSGISYGCHVWGRHGIPRYATTTDPGRALCQISFFYLLVAYVELDQPELLPWREHYITMRSKIKYIYEWRTEKLKSLCRHWCDLSCVMGVL